MLPAVPRSAFDAGGARQRAKALVAGKIEVDASREPLMIAFPLLEEEAAESRDRQARLAADARAAEPPAGFGDLRHLQHDRRRALRIILRPGAEGLERRRLVDARHERKIGLARRGRQGATGVEFEARRDARAGSAGRKPEARV